MPVKAPSHKGDHDCGHGPARCGAAVSQNGDLCSKGQLWVASSDAALVVPVGAAEVRSEYLPVCSLATLVYSLDDVGTSWCLLSQLSLRPDRLLDKLDVVHIPAAHIAPAVLVVLAGDHMDEAFGWGMVARLGMDAVNLPKDGGDLNMVLARAFPEVHERNSDETVSP